MSKSTFTLVATCVLTLGVIVAWRAVIHAKLRAESDQAWAKPKIEAVNQPAKGSAYNQLTNWLPFVPLTYETPTWARAQQCVRELGTNAIPALIALLQQQDTNFLRPGLMTRSQGLASFGFNTLGPLAAPAVSSLVECMDDERPQVRAAAATCLGEIGAPASNAAPRLVAALSDPSPDVRVCAALALDTVPSDAELAVPALTSFLRGSHPEGDMGDWGQMAAIGVLGRYDTAQAIPFLRKMTNATSDSIQWKARRLLSSIESPPKAVLQPETVYDEQVRKFNQR